MILTIGERRFVTPALCGTKLLGVYLAASCRVRRRTDAAQVRDDVTRRQRKV